MKKAPLIVIISASSMLIFALLSYIHKLKYSTVGPVGDRDVSQLWEELMLRLFIGLIFLVNGILMYNKQKKNS